MGYGAVLCLHGQGQWNPERSQYMVQGAWGSTLYFQSAIVDYPGQQGDSEDCGGLPSLVAG